MSLSVAIFLFIPFSPPPLSSLFSALALDKETFSKGRSDSSGKMDFQAEPEFWKR